MEFRVLGPTELWSGDRKCDLGAERKRSILAMLLLTPQTIVPATALIDRLWDGEPPPKARESLSVYVTRLRTCLRQAVGDRVQLDARARGYVLDVDPEVVDLHRFRTMRRQADALTDSGDNAGAARLLREADALWRGQALAGLRGDWLARMSHSLEDERRAAILERVERELELGRHASLVGELRALLAHYPHDETFVGHQMIALYRSGRQNDALSLYRETRDRMVDEQGTEPGMALAELHQMMLLRDPSLDLRQKSSPPSPPSILAASPTTGRRSTESTSTALASPARPVPVTTPDIDGSYRALAPAQQRLFRQLGLSPCASISPGAAAALGAGTLSDAERGLATLLDHHLLSRGEAGQFSLSEFSRGFAAMRAARDEPVAQRRLTVARLLDYYLHTADQADRLLHPFRSRMHRPVTRRAADGPRLSTAEEAAGWLDQEWQNILQTAQYAGRHEWKQQCADLTHLIAGFLETAGNWSEAIEAHSVALQACRDLAEPDRIARAALNLDAVYLQVGRPEATLGLAEEATSIYRSLGDDPGLAQALDQVGLVNERAARYREALAYFREASTLFDEAGDQHGLAGTMSHSGIASSQLGRYPEAMKHLRAALKLYRAVADRRGEAKTLNNLGKIELNCGFHRDALASFRESLNIFTEIGGEQNRAILFHNIGNVYHYKGGHEKGLTAYRQALLIYREIGDLPNEADVLSDIGAIYHSAERFDEALIHYQRARLIAEQTSNAAAHVIALRGIADVRRGSGQYAEAAHEYSSALGLAKQTGDPYQEARAIEGIAETRLSTMQPHSARILLRQALDIYERLGVPEAESARIRLETIEPSLDRRATLSARQASSRRSASRRLAAMQPSIPLQPDRPAVRGRLALRADPRQAGQRQSSRPASGRSSGPGPRCCRAVRRSVS